MLRVRRYRLLLFTAALLTLLLVRFARDRDRQWVAELSPAIDDFGGSSNTDNRPGQDKLLATTGRAKPVIDVEKLAHADGWEDKPIPPVKDASSTSVKSNKGGNTAQEPPDPANRQDDELDDYVRPDPPSRVEPGPYLEDTSPQPIRGQKQPEHFPVPSGTLIQLPQGDPVAIPKIQFAFSEETPENKAKREQRQESVLEQFVRAWAGYKRRAWKHDEVAPLSGNSLDPFCGWGATLVDSLDTLWIMGLEQEFEEAVEAVASIDFTTGTRPDLPIFETTIRYLGGLIGAYDISGMKYKTLLDKAVELADILMGAFDTPNRMPLLYYQWMPDYASQPHRASTSANLAELGSLSMEFTRLAQLTKRHKYYDAVARITNNLAEMQDRTAIPGIFPDNIDASGCNRSATDRSRHYIQARVDFGNGAEGYKAPMPEPPPEPFKSRSSRIKPDIELRVTPGEPSKGHLKVIEVDLDGKKLAKREMESNTSTETVGRRSFEISDWDCVPQGLEVSTSWVPPSFSMGGGQDSTYEYFSKEYLLLGGRTDQHRQMYLKAMDAVRNHLIYRPMVPDGRDILFSGKLRPNLKKEGFYLEPEVTHLTCFIGGMIGMGAKVFNLKEDLEMAKKLTNGCVWAYESTTSGIMPEAGMVVPCKSQKECVWDESAWWRWIDPLADSREEEVKEYKASQAKLEDNLADADAIEEKFQKAKLAESKLDQKEFLEEMEHPPPANTRDTKTPDESSQVRDSKSLTKRLDVQNFGERKAMHDTQPVEALQQKLKDTKSELDSELPVRNGLPLPEPELDPLEDPMRPLTHEEFVTNTISDQKLTPGWTSISNREYMLRPEAIESIFYMYRITGDPSWQDKGWNMFQRIIPMTTALHGHSTLADVTRPEAGQTDKMESFWTAETLKYFWLLFAKPDVVSLDEWVFNTEAHPFKRGG